MLALRYAALLALVVWVGGLAVLGGVAAPATFDVLGAVGSQGRARAADVFAEMLRRFHLTSYGCGAVIVCSLAARAVLGPRPRRFAVRMSIAAVMIAAAAWSGMKISPQVARARQEIGAPSSSLPKDDQRRLEFTRLHRISTMLQLVPFAGGLALLLWELRD